MNNQKSILYIDDEKENLTGFRYAFRKEYNIFTAASANEGLDILQKVEIKVVISDQRMPQQTGTQFFEKVAESYPHIYRIILTAYTDVQDIIEAINRGKIYQYLRKPWDKEELKMIIDNALKSYDLEQHNRELLNSLQESNNKLAAINNDLEQKVAERTSEIEIKNKELEKHRNHLEQLVRKRTLELEKAKVRAEESDKLKSSFLANVSHEIRTPMNAIVGFTELLMLEEYTDDEKIEFKENIVFNSEALLRLIDDILDISKIEANQLTFNYEPHNLNKVFDELKTTFNKQLELLNKPHLNLICDCCKELENIIVITDKVRLNQILTNLVGNAIKFTDKGYVKFGFDIIHEPGEDKSILIKVEDSGIGISDDAMKIIFDRFRKVEMESPKLFRGAGLGLYIVKNLVDKMDGKIWPESKLNQGASFFVQLPYNPQDNQIKKLNELFPKSDTIDLKGKTIVITEDEDASYILLEKILQPTQANIVRAHNGNETIQYLSLIQNVDLILMDMQMPGMNGLEATSIIKREFPHIPIIAQTAYAFAEQQEKMWKAGCDAIVLKPYRKKQIVDTVAKHLQKVFNNEK